MTFMKTFMNLGEGRGGEGREGEWEGGEGRGGEREGGEGTGVGGEGRRQREEGTMESEMDQVNRKKEHTVRR